MKKAANYIIKVRTEDGEYIFEYATVDVWTALGEFWHEDWSECLADQVMTKAWPMDVYAMEDGKIIRTYKFEFDMSVFHAFYDHGRITLDEFAKYVERKDDVTITIGRDEVLLIVTAMGTYQNRIGQHARWTETKRIPRIQKMMEEEQDEGKLKGLNSLHRQWTHYVRRCIKNGKMCNAIKERIKQEAGITDSDKMLPPTAAEN